MEDVNNLVLIGNGFDLAHGLKTSYKDFIDWYFINSFDRLQANKICEDTFIDVRYKYPSYSLNFTKPPLNFGEVINYLKSSSKYINFSFKCNFFNDVVSSINTRGWVDIELMYYQKLKNIFRSNISIEEKKQKTINLNNSFNYLISKLSEYIIAINREISNTSKLPFYSKNYNLVRVLDRSKNKLTFLNFNYTETLLALEYGKEDEIIHIHGRVSDEGNNPIIFGYGDESDPVYQEIEDSGENIFLEHIKSFNYFQSDRYSKFISLIDSNSFNVYVLGHSCGLSDRILLNEIFEHKNCNKIEVFYHKKQDGTDNFKEITQEISRHFKPQNKNLMRRRVGFKDVKNIIPQNLQKLST